MCGGHVRRIAAVDGAHRIGNPVGHFEQRGCVEQMVACRVDALAQHADHCLGPGEAAGAEHDDHAIAGALEHRHLAELGVVVDAGVRARIAREDQPLLELQTDAVGHAPSRPGGSATLPKRSLSRGAS